MSERKESDVPEEIQRLLKEVCDHFDLEDRIVRERQIRIWRKLKFYWNGFQKLWYSEVAHDWRVFDTSYNYADNDSTFYDKPINVFKAYLESIIAALSVNIPSIKCFPDDADNALDLSTAKAGDKIAELIYRHNDVPILWLHALYIFCTEGLIAAYSYPKEDEKYGTYDEPSYEDDEVDVENKYCSNCGAKLPEGDEQLDNAEVDEFMPGDDDVESHDLLQHGAVCPQCLVAADPELRSEKIIVTRMVGTTTKPKSRQCIEVYGGLFVKVPNYAMKQADIPYLIFAYETHYSNVLQRYPWLREKLNTTIRSSSGSMYDSYERWGRLSTQYAGEYPLNTPTVRNCWLRPSAFNVLNDEDDVKELQKRYPDGAKVVLVNDQFADAENECLDDCWTLTQNPLADYLHHDPLGLGLTSVQDITNDLVSLVLQTIEHGIPQTFADPAVLNFDQYRQTEATPGMIFPAKGTAGKSIGEGFYEVKIATLSAEVQPFAQRIQEMGQLVSGAMPTIFGGAAPNSSKTAAQYAMSRAQSLQRLQTQWKMLTLWWKNIFGKAIPSYIKTVVDAGYDERVVQSDESGNFVNVFIRKAELEGKLGSVELEASDQLPIMWSQRKDIIMQLMQGGSPEVMAALASPENLPLLSEAIGLDDFILPGEDDRQKQYEEIRVLLKSEPIMVPPDENAIMQAMATGQPPQSEEKPSVEVEPYVDNHVVEADICRRWLVSDAGRLAKTENPGGYRNVLLHMKQHIDIHSAMMMSQMQAQSSQPIGESSGQGEGNNPEGKPNKKPIASKPAGAASGTVQ